MYLGVYVLHAVALARILLAWAAVKRPQCGKRRRVPRLVDAEGAAYLRVPAGGNVVQMRLDYATHVLAHGRVGDVVHLRKQALAYVARSAARGVELSDLREDCHDLRLALPERHRHVGEGALVVAVVVQVADKHLGERPVLPGDVGRRQLREEVGLQRLLTDLVVEERLPPLRRLLVVAAYPDVLLLGEVGRVVGRLALALDLGEVRLQRALNVLDGRVAGHLRENLGAKLGQGLGEQLQPLELLGRDCERLLLPLALAEFERHQNISQGGRSPTIGLAYSMNFAVTSCPFRAMNSFGTLRVNFAASAIGVGTNATL